MSYGAQVGIKFRESMSGYLAPGAATPEAGDQAGKGKPQNFAFRLEVTLASLRAFLDAPSHEARVTAGSLRWDGHARDGTPVAPGGSVVMYRNVTPDGRHKQFDFLFSFQADNGVWHTVTGTKRLVDDHGFDAGTDLSTLYVEVAAQGPAIAKGVTRVHVDELLDQLVSLSTPGATNPRESSAARAAFFTFMNEQIHQVYPSLPFLVRADPDSYLSAGEWRALMLVLAVMLPSPLPADGPTAKDTIANLQQFIRAADRHALEQIRSGIRALGLVAPLAQGFVPEIRTYVRHTLESAAASQARNICELFYRMAVLPYFSLPQADALVGYRRPVFEPKHNTVLRVSELPSPRVVDVAIVGAGVAGSLLAERLTRAGKTVLLLEAGPYVAERDMTSDELVMTARLYKAAGLQAVNAEGPQALSTGSFFALQAACVGGGGTVNNAICIQLPERRLERWRSLGFPIAAADLRDSYTRVRQDLGIQPASRATELLNPSGRYLESLGPIQQQPLDGPPPEGLSECLVNIEAGCKGAGLCNSGCGNERKRNALQVYLPRALDTHECELVPNARVVEIRASGGQVTSLLTEIGGQRYELLAREYVLAAGPVASSALLLQSPSVSNRLQQEKVPVGQRFCANVGSPMFARFGRMMQPRPSLQISHCYLPPGSLGYIVESWFAPPGTLALALPGYFEQHWQRVHAYSNLITLGPLVGTQARGSISVANGKVDIQLPLSPDDDFARLRDAIATVGRAILKSGDPDLIEVIAGTRQGFSMRTEADVQRFIDSVRSPADLRLGTGHPQGGNAMSEDPAIGVIGADFRVRGFSNLRICDASVFPEVAGVNPQWTVMALADRCAQLLVA
jgi:choline dehydrogenase-like flavoprotein